MSYAPTHPRPRSIIYDHPYWRKSPLRKGLLTQAIARPIQKTGTLVQLSGYFDTRTNYDCQKCLQNNLRPLSKTSREIFTDATILPYYFSPKEERALDPGYKKQFEAVRQRYAVARTGREPSIYRITDFTFCDDLGRIYDRGDPTKGQDATLLYFHQYKLTRKKLYRNLTWFRGPDGWVELAAYIGVGYAGYEPDVQEMMYSSLKYDVHHVEENKFDIRPSTLLPLPTWMHLRWVHANDFVLPQRTLFHHDRKHGLIWSNKLN